MPQGALGKGEPTLKVVDPETGEERPPVRFAPDGRPTNLEEAVGEIVETAPTSSFEGYYRNEEATNARFRDGWYWSGDLAFRDDDDWLYFAGRSNEWLRVDGENFAAAPVEAIIGRYPDVRSLAVYAVPDDPVGDRVMVASGAADRCRVRPGRLRRVPRRATRPRAEVGSRVRVGHRGSSQVGEFEDRQATPAPRGVAHRAGVLASGEGRAAAAARRCRPVAAGSAPAPRVRVVVFGATGVIGRAALDHFSRLPDCDVIGVSRRAVDVEGVTHIPLDLLDRRACERAGRAMAGVTHVVYAALQESDDLTAGWRDRALMERNLAMFSNALDPLLDATGDTLAHVSLLQGAKAYGLHVGRSTVPAKERAPRDEHDNFYFLQEDRLRALAADASWSWTILRPQVVYGRSFGSPMNLIPVLGVYGALLHARRPAAVVPGWATAHPGSGGRAAPRARPRLVGDRARGPR